MLNQLCLRNYRKKEKGYSIVELLCVLMVIAILIGVIVAVYYKVSRNAHKDQTKTEVLEIASAAKDWKAGRTNYSGLTMDALCQEDGLSKDLCGDRHNSFGGSYSIASTGPNNSQFIITTDGVPTGIDASLSEELRPSSLDQKSTTGTGGTVTMTDQ